MTEQYPDQQHDFVPVVTLDEQQRQEYPTIVFEHIGVTPRDEVALKAVIDVMQRAGVPMVCDIVPDEELSIDRLVVRTVELERNERPAASALVHGAVKVAYNNMVGDNPINSMVVATETAVRQIVDNPELAEEFRSYYGGLGWGTDQDRFTRTLFEHGTTYDEELLDHSLTLEKTLYLIEELQPDFTYEERRPWRDKTLPELFEAYPDVDYHKLQDAGFADTAEGRRLAAAYAKVCGTIKAEQYKRVEAVVTTEGVVLPEPVIPLSKFPLIEAIMVDEVSLSKPKAKYDLGRSEVVSLVVASDSLAAQEAIVEAAITRLPREDRHVWDGPDEFTHKFNLIRNLTHAYQNATDPERRDQFKDMVLDILDAYTDNGVMANEMRAEYFEHSQAGYGGGQIKGVKDIVKSILTIGLVSPDAEQFLMIAMPETETDLATEVDPLALNQADRIVVLLDALKKVDQNSRAEVFWRLAKKTFQDVTIADSILSIAEMRIEASRQYQSPAAWLARMALRRFSFSLHDKKPDHLKAEADLEAVTAGATELSAVAEQMTNDLLIIYLQDMIDAGMVAEADTADNILFKALVDRVSYGDMWRATELPAAYYELITLAKSSQLNDHLKSTIVWKLAERTQHADDALRQLLPAAIIDGYEVLLGNLGSLRLPNRQIAHGIGAVAFMAHSPYVFKHASEEQLRTLRQYYSELQQLVERYLTASLPNPDGTETDQHEMVGELRYVLQDMDRIEDNYREYLYLEDVKQFPRVYYPWVLKEIVPFWQKMQWEVGPGQRPSREVRELYDVLKDHIENKLVVREDDYPENFDVFEDGHFDTLLIEGYRRMVVPHDIQYVTTVWQDGLSFMLNTVLMMPESVVQQFADKYGETAEVVKYIKRTRDHYNKSDNDQA